MFTGEVTASTDGKQNAPQFPAGSGMSEIFRDKFWWSRDSASDLISLRPAGQEDRLSRKVSGSKWIFRIPFIGVGDQKARWPFQLVAASGEVTMEAIISSIWGKRLLIYHAG